MDTLICLSNADDAEELAGRLSTGNSALRFRRIDAPNWLFGTGAADDVAAVLLDPPLMDRHLALLRAHSLVAPVRFKSIVAAPHPDALLMIRAIHFGFDDVVDTRTAVPEMLDRINSILTGDETIHLNPVLAAIDLVPGLYRRSLRFTEATDGTIVDLLALGLGDGDISTVLGIPVQAVRNRIARLLREHGLSSRTQLATLHIRNQIAEPTP